jgi:hypothetical protein
VSKIGLFLTSLVAAIPGGFMAYLMVMAFLNHSGGPNMWTKALAGMLLCIGGLLGVMPVGILLFAGPKTEKQPKEPKKKPAAKDESEEIEAESGEVEADSGEVEAELEEVDEGEPAVATTDKNLVVVEEDEFAMTGEMVAEEEAVVDEFDAGDDFETDAALVDSDDMLEVEEDEPKKGKKKK